MGKRKRKNTNTTSLKAILVWFVIGIAGLATMYFYIDRRVVRFLETGTRQESLSGIYSDAYEISDASTIDLPHLRSLLARRNYSEVGDATKKGEYSVSDVGVTIVTRSFVDARGKEIPSVRGWYSFVDHDVRVDGASNDKRFFLEPELLSPLGSSSTRAAENVQLHQIPVSLRKAVVAIEDERFEHHFGIDFLGILRAMAANIRAMSLVQGGSTITQQLAKNLFLTPRKTIGRKVSEMLAAVSLESRLEKTQILELYLNEVYFGQEGPIAIHGVAEAARSFFGKEVSEISLNESALLAGIIKAPSYFSPRKHFRRALDRRDTVLVRMRELGFINDRELKAARLARPKIIANPRYKRSSPFYITALRQELDQFFSVEAAESSGVAVYTGLNLDLQECAEEAVSGGLDRIEKDYPALKSATKPLEGALVAIEPHSGKIRAWVGGRDYSERQFDHVNQAMRQIGSTVKPFLYLTALDGSLNSYRVATPVTLVSDAPMEVDLVTKSVWEPENYDRQFRGDVTFRYALEHSLNIPAVYIAQRVGLSAFARTLKSFGLAESVPLVPAIALGAVDTTLLELTSAYSAIANGGTLVSPRMFLVARGGNGEDLAAKAYNENPVADERAVYVLTDMLRGVIERGTGSVVRRMGYLGPVAGKTGTSSDTRDSWFEGFTPELTVGVWVGYDDDSKTGLTGAQGAGILWTRFMQCSQPFRQNLDFIAPSGVVMVNVDSESGGIATNLCPRESVIKEVFVEGTEPRQRCRLHLRYDQIDDQYENRMESVDRRRREDRRRHDRSLWDVIFGR